MFCSAITTRKTHPKPVLFIFEQTLHQSTYSSKAASCQAETELVNTFAFPTVTLGVIANSRHLYLWYVLFPNTGAYVRTNTATGSHFSICGPFNNCTGKQWCPRRGRAASISQVLYKTWPVLAAKNSAIVAIMVFSSEQRSNWNLVWSGTSAQNELPGTVSVLSQAWMGTLRKFRQIS